MSGLNFLRRGLTRRPRRAKSPTSRVRLNVEALGERCLPSTTALMVKDINPNAGTTIRNSDPANLTSLGATLFFTAQDATHGVELWKTDGTEAGTVMVRDIRLGSTGSEPRNLTAIGSTLYFTADDGANGRELWKTDGTLTGTRMVNNVYPGAPGSDPRALTAVGSTLFFIADDGVTGRELWKSDGSTSGTVLVRDIRSGPMSSSGGNLTAVGSTLYFTAKDGVPFSGSPTGIQLWKSDGTTAGTTMLMFAVSTAATMTELTALGSSVFYVFDPDGSLGASAPVLSSARSFPGGSVSGAFFDADGNIVAGEIFNLTTVDSDLYCSYRQDTSSPMCSLVRLHNGRVEHLADDFDFRPAEFTSVNGTVFFSASSPAHRSELWKYDGNSVVEVADINPSGSSFPGRLTNVNGTLYFHASDGVNGNELWQSDGTAGGTRMVRNINGTGNSNPGRLCGINNTLYFAADDGANGIELWKTRPNTAPSIRLPFGPFCRSTEGVATTILALSSDADNDPLTTTVTGLPAGLSFNALTGTITGQPAYSAGRTMPYTVNVTASDGFEVSSASFQLLVWDPTGPTFPPPGTQVSNEGNTVSLPLGATDPDGDRLSYLATGLPPGLILDSNAGVISGTLSPQSAGTYDVVIRVSDQCWTATHSFTWTVNDLSAPTLTNPGPQHSNRGNTLSLDIVASDADGDELTFVAFNLPPGLSIDARTGRISGTIGASTLSSYEVTISVSDDINKSTVTFTWTIG